MTSQPQPLSTISLPGQRKRRAAQRLLALHSTCVRPAQQKSGQDTIKIVCISDTHNTRPKLPPGDVLIHAGDLTENGSFDEMQTELNWLSSQPHRYKLFVAGNHDVLLDEQFLQKYPERRYGSRRTKEDLEWGTVIHLKDSSIKLEFPHSAHKTAEPGMTTQGKQPKSRVRSLLIYGSPFTPRYGASAFQYAPDPDFWTERFASLSRAPDILVTHGPPKLHLDTRDFHRAGCPYLSGEVARLRPRLHVFGHIHASYGCEDVVLDGMQRAYEEVMTGWGGWATVGWMMSLMLWERLAWLCRGFRAREERLTTTFVNAAVVGGRDNSLVKKPVVFQI